MAKGKKGRKAGSLTLGELQRSFAALLRRVEKFKELTIRYSKLHKTA